MSTSTGGLLLEATTRREEAIAASCVEWMESLKE